MRSASPEGMDMDVLELLSQLVEFETVNDPAKGIKPTKECPKFIKDTLEEWEVEADVFEENGYYGVLGEIGKGYPKLLFMAHFDVVPVNPEEWNTDPFKLTIIGNKAYGRGSVDDKGNVAAVMVALKELAKEDIKGKIIFAFTGDEEIGGFLASKIAERLKEENKLPKYMINADGIGMKPIIRRRKGFGAVIRVPIKKIKVKGKIKSKTFKVNTPILETRHAAYFLPGVDTHPLIAASHFVRTKEVPVVSLEGKFLKGNVVPSEVTLTYLERGDGEEVEVDLGLTELMRSIVPVVRAPIKAEKYSDYGVSITPNMYSIENEKHVLRLDIRAMSNSKEDIEKTLKEVISFTLPEGELEVKTNEKAGYLFTSPEEKIVKVALEVLRELGEDVKPVEGPGASDSRYFTPYGVKAIDIGPKGGNIHGPNEFVEIDSLKKMPKVYKEIALRL
ncbi:succinyl-diaminopimelate desuccinylase [Pyrococcus furiosus DSM 3638]|uniref:Succinyl-diaminopimelate desuccinylase n=3 Tax=Pyrococcus furiosus TaxID=2261 RepID=Q8TZE7_PYRFU|nr:succinyl-diaminopimelate desuccinylase [Pyrococcus furiosus DSM 3638]